MTSSGSTCLGSGRACWRKTSLGRAHFARRSPSRPSGVAPQGRQGHLDARVIAGGLIVEPAAVIVLAVDAQAVEEIALLGDAVDRRPAGEEVGWRGGKILGHEVVELGRVAAGVGAVRGQREGNVYVSFDLHGAVVGLLHLSGGRKQEAQEDVADGLADLVAGVLARQDIREETGSS